MVTANAINISTYGVVFFDSTGSPPAFTAITPGVSGTILTSTGATTSPTWQAPSISGFPWTDEATSFGAVANNGYFVTAAATATLPASPSQGDAVAFAYDAATGAVTITANTGQVIRVGSVVSATAGTCVSQVRGDSIKLVYRTVGSAWICVGAPQGVWIVT